MGKVTLGTTWWLRVRLAAFTLVPCHLHKPATNRHKTARPAEIPKGYFRGRDLDQYRVNAVSSVFRNHSATSFVWKGRSSRSRSRLSNSVISPTVLGFLILFNARKMCSLRQRLEFGTFFIAGSTVSKG